jgi:hypothetical protein
MLAVGEVGAADVEDAERDDRGPFIGSLVADQGCVVHPVERMHGNRELEQPMPLLDRKIITEAVVDRRRLEGAVCRAGGAGPGRKCRSGG